MRERTEEVAVLHSDFSKSCICVEQASPGLYSISTSKPRVLLDPRYFFNPLICREERRGEGSCLYIPRSSHHGGPGRVELMDLRSRYAVVEDLLANVDHDDLKDQRKKFTYSQIFYRIFFLFLYSNLPAA